MSDWQQARMLLGDPWPGGFALGEDLRADYARFLQAEVSPWEREDRGLQGIFRSIFPIWDFNETASLEFVSYELRQPKETPAECRRGGETYAAPLVVTLRLIIYDVPSGEAKRIRDIKEQEILICSLPVLTPEGTFVIGGYDRVIVRQLAPTPGIRFSRPEDTRMRAVLTPERGSRLTFEIDKKGLVWFRVNSSSKMPASVILRALGMNTEEIVQRFYPIEKFIIEPDGKVWLVIDWTELAGRRSWMEIRINGEVWVKKNRKFTRAAVRKLRDAGITRLQIDPDTLTYRTFARDCVDQRSGEVIGEVTYPLPWDWLQRLRQAQINEFELVVADGFRAQPWMVDTLRKDRTQTPDEAMIEIYRRLRPGDPPVIETARHLFSNLFFNPERTHLSLAGRRVLNRKLHQGKSELSDAMTLTREDILEALRELLAREVSEGKLDDPDDVSEAMVRDVGALVGNAMRQGLVRMERATKERMSISQEIDTLMPHDLVNGRPVTSALADFFAFSRVSERINFTSPAAELMQRRRMSTAEPDQGSPQRGSGYTLRESHDSYLGYFCPIERGMVAAPSLACKVDGAGMLQTSCEPLERQQWPEWRPPLPWEVLGFGASLIPFVNHDAPLAATRGVDSLRSALPPFAPEPALVASGMEAEAAHSAGLTVKATEAGRVARVSASGVVVEGSQGEQRYELRSFEPSPRGAYVRQRPVVAVGQRVAAGEVLAVGPGVAAGEVAVGHNVRVALVAGPTFGESVVVSERLVREGRFATLHLREFRAMVASAGLVGESFTRDVPGLDDEEREALDERGLIRVGSRVRGGDVLAGRVRAPTYTPEGEEPEPPEDASLRMPPGQEGVVIRAVIEGRRQVSLPKRCSERARVLVGALRALEVGDLLGSRHGDRGAVARIAPEEDMPMLPDGRPVDVLLNPAWLLEAGAAGAWMELLTGALGAPVVVPPFASASEARVRAMWGGDGRVMLRDGRTGEFLDMPAAVGVLYLMKLPPLAADAMEARSTGAYDPRTELPVAGPLAAGGQLLGEEEIMALLAHGAAHTLREVLAGKSDDAVGREELAQAIRTGDAIEGHVPQGVDALFRELRAAALHVEAEDPRPDPPPAAAPTPAAAAAAPAAPVPELASASSAASAPATARKRRRR